MMVGLWEYGVWGKESFLEELIYERGLGIYQAYTF